MLRRTVIYEVNKLECFCFNKKVFLNQTNKMESKTFWKVPESHHSYQKQGRKKQDLIWIIADLGSAKARNLLWVFGGWALPDCPSIPILSIQFPGSLVNRVPGKQPPHHTLARWSNTPVRGYRTPMTPLGKPDREIQAPAAHSYITRNIIFINVLHND